MIHLFSPPKIHNLLLLQKKLVPKAGLEPARVASLPPQDSVSTKFHHFGTQYAQLRLSLLDTFAKPHFLLNFIVRLKFQSSKYSMYSCLPRRSP